MDEETDVPHTAHEMEEIPQSLLIQNQQHTSGKYIRPRPYYAVGVYLDDINFGGDKRMGGPIVVAAEIILRRGPNMISRLDECTGTGSGLSRPPGLRIPFKKWRKEIEGIRILGGRIGSPDWARQSLIDEAMEVRSDFRKLSD